MKVVREAERDGLVLERRTRDEASLSYRAVDKLHPDAGVSTSYQLRTGRGSTRLDTV